LYEKLKVHNECGASTSEKRAGSASKAEVGQINALNFNFNR